MSVYPQKEISYKRIFGISFREYLVALRYSFVFIMLLMFGLFLGQAVPHWNLGYYALSAIQIIYFLVAFYLFSVAVLNTHWVFSDAKKSVGEACKTSFFKFFKMVLTFVCYVLAVVATLYLFHFLKVLVLHFDKQASDAVKGFLVFLQLGFLAIILCMFFLSYPLSIIDQKSIKKSFLDSALLSEKNKTGIFLLIFMISFSYSSIHEGGNHFHVIANYHLSYLYDFIVLLLIVPLFINVLLFMINDSRNQLVIEE